MRLRHHLLILAAPLAVALVSTVGTQEWSRLGGSTIEESVEDFRENEGLPGAVVAFGKIGQEPTLHAFGFDDLEAGSAMTADMRFAIASLSKPITAAALLDLAARGRVEIDGRLSSYLPEITSESSDPRMGSVTLRDLLRHSGGWDRAVSFEPILEFEQAERELDLQTPRDCRTIALAMLRRPLDFAPGQRYAYSNLGYCWLEQVISKAAGRPYEQVVRSFLASRIGSNEISIGFRKVAPSRRVHHYGLIEGRLQPVPWTDRKLRILGAAGGWTASAKELFRIFSSVEIGDAGSRPPYERGEGAYYGLGWRVWPDPQGAYLTHFGAMPGAFSFVLRGPGNNLLVALFNGRPVDDWHAFNSLAEALLEVLRRERTAS